MVEELPTWFVVVSFVTLSVVAVYRLWIEPNSKGDDCESEREL